LLIEPELRDVSPSLRRARRTGQSHCRSARGVFPVRASRAAVKKRTSNRIAPAGYSPNPACEWMRLIMQPPPPPPPRKCEGGVGSTMTNAATGSRISGEPGEERITSPKVHSFSGMPRTSASTSRVTLALGGKGEARRRHGQVHPGGARKRKKTTWRKRPGCS
jgi:hypothetical protein